MLGHYFLQIRLVYTHHQRPNFVSGTFDIFNVLCKPYHRTALNPFFNGMTNGDIDVVHKTSFTRIITVTIFGTIENWVQYSTAVLFTPNAKKIKSADHKTGDAGGMCKQDLTRKRS